MGRTSSFFHFGIDSSCYVVSSGQFRRSSSLSLFSGNRCVNPFNGFFFSSCIIIFGGFRQILEHEAFAFVVAKNTTFAPDAFRYQNASHTWRPYHAGGVELHKFHVNQVGAKVISHGMSVPSVLPAIGGDCE
ncbi:MAG: hypothetical protein BWY75_01390 [bacterium ADurb.Bin425]|nr:MAG: hypothetical protein BWY75_01390 [bacterium ADurb.Bin425]